MIDKPPKLRTVKLPGCSFSFDWCMYVCMYVYTHILLLQSVIASSVNQL